jgi:hypothetical protein
MANASSTLFWTPRAIRKGSHKDFRRIEIRPCVGNLSCNDDAEPFCQPPHCSRGPAPTDDKVCFRNLRLH